MIKDKQSLSMAETLDVLQSIKGTDRINEVQVFIKKFIKLSPEKARKLREALEGLNLLKVKQSDISKLIDVLPEDASELNKVFTEVVLDTDETNKILETIKQNR